MHERFQANGRVYQVSIERQGEGYLALVDGQPYEFTLLDAAPGQMSLLFAGRPAVVYWAADGERKWVTAGGCTYVLERPAPRAANGGAEAPTGRILRAPMPAQVRAVQVAPGDEVEAGRTLMLLEAMKMEIRIKAPAGGRVVRLPVSDGQSVDKDQVLAEIGE